MYILSFFIYSIAKKIKIVKQLVNIFVKNLVKKFTEISWLFTKSVLYCLQQVKKQMKGDTDEEYEDSNHGI